MGPADEHHEIGQCRVGVDAASADLAHQIHAHRITAEREKGGVAEGQDAGVTPHQIDRESENRVAQIFAGNRNDEVRHMQRAHRGNQQVHRREHCSATKHTAQRRDVSAVEPHYASAARPFSGNSPCGRRWMNRIRNTKTMILASTAPSNGSTNLSTMPSSTAPNNVPHRLPTPPTTTTMKLSTM